MLQIETNNTVEKKEQLNRVATLFRRQLCCPLLDMEKTMEEYDVWRSTIGADLTIDDDMIRAGYERALESLRVRLPYEEKLLSVQDDNELADAYRGYLLYEKQHGDPGRVTVLYERAVTDVSLDARIWVDYIEYLEKHIIVDTIIDRAYARASRNVPWCAKIWQKWMRRMEKSEKPLLEVQALLENALAGFARTGVSTADEYRNVWITFIEYLRRRIDHEKSTVEEEKQIEIIRSTFNRACEHLANLFGLDGDPQCVILQYWARTEAIHANDMEKARKLWTDILSQGHSAYAASWLEYIALEKSYGDTKHLRKLYVKALAAVKDWPESIVSSWIDFERDEGTLEQMEFCESKTTEKMEKVLEERQKLQHTAIRSSEYSEGQHVRKANKRKNQPDEGRWKNLGGSMDKRQKIEKPRRKSATTSAEQPSTSAVSTVKPKIAPPPGYKHPPEIEHIEAENNQEVNDKITVFCSNLDYEATEEEVKEALSAAGEIMLVRMVRDYKKRSKGFCYVQFDSEVSIRR